MQTDQLSLKSTSFDAIDQYILDQMQRFNIPGVSVAIVEGDQIVHQRGFGCARPDGEVPTSKTPFFIGSLTKSITALAILQLVEGEKIELDAPVQRYLPWFCVADPVASAQITVRHLLNHTSGLPMLPGMADLENHDRRPDANERQVRALSTFKLTRPIGEKFEYSNTNYNILGLIIEVTSGETYSDYVQQHIFKPLGMSHSFTSKSAALQNGLAMGYRYWFGHPFPAPDLDIPAGSLPSGQLISCTEDMAHYLIANLNEGRYSNTQILSKTGINEMHRGAVSVDEAGIPRKYYGMGWMSQRTGSSEIVWHSGIVPDFGAFMGIVPSQKKGIVLLFNANHAMTKLTFDEFGLGAAERLAGEIPTPTRFGFAPWAMRSLLLIPIFQIAGVIFTFRQISRWHANPVCRPTSKGLWWRHILLPLIPNLLAAFPLIPMAGKMRGFISLFMPDYSWIALISGSFAGFWSFLRTVLILGALRKPRV